MTLDLVHDVQEAFRKMLSAMSFPGSLESLATTASKVGLELGYHPGIFVLLRVLLDAEVTFCVVGKDNAGLAETWSQFISQVTYAPRAPLDLADFVLLLEEEASLGSLLPRMKEGDLVDPQRSATVVMSVESLVEGDTLSLQGPGIPNSKSVKISGAKDWVKARAHKNREFPLGVDLFLVDRLGNLMALPRTTQMQLIPSGGS